MGDEGGEAATLLRAGALGRACRPAAAPRAPTSTSMHLAGTEAGRIQGSFPEPQTDQVNPTSRPHSELS